MQKSRPGSILFTSISMTAIFLTLVVASVSYVQSSTKRASNDRWRDTAEQAARSGFEYIMGWAQANIDSQTRLPADWGTMTDGEIIDPVAAYTQGVAAIAPPVGDIFTLAGNQNGPGMVLGRVGGLPNNTTEYVLSRQGNYLVTFKSRIQQFRYSDNMPRQYRIGVIGRVRLIPNRAGVGDINGNERGTIIAERFLMSYVGQDPVSRYAALIDYDAVQNWVPGIVINGPVHINRGYVDSPIERVNNPGNGAPLATPNGPQGTGITIGATAIGIHPRSEQIRSVMNIRTSAGGLFGSVGAAVAPQFNDEVSMTGIVAVNDPAYRNLDLDGLPAAVKINGQPYTAANVAAMGGAALVFRAPENQPQQPRLNNQAGPVIRDRPVILPSSVRNRLGSVLGVPINTNINSYVGGTVDWSNLADGIYIPTNAFWGNGAGTSVSYNNQPASGGIYVRGNVEVMRMGVFNNGAERFSYYLFQLGYGGLPLAGGAPNPAVNKRCYAVVTRRNTAEMWLMAWPRGQAVPGLSPGGVVPSTTFAQLFPGLAGGTTVAGAANGPHAPSAFDMLATAPGPIINYFPSGGNPFPFNGVIFVDISRDDLARNAANPQIYNPVPPLTGNIFALGDPGMPQGGAGTEPWRENRKRHIGSNANPDGTLNRREMVATYRTTPDSDASRLTIMATGNIFIQNHIQLESLSATAGYPDYTGNTSENVGLLQSRDLLGIVADKQVVLGLAATSSDNIRPDSGLIVHAAIAALGDPAYNYVTRQANPIQMTGPPAFRGSFTTEGLMQYYGAQKEQYYVCNTGPRNMMVYTGYPAVGSADFVPLGVTPVVAADNQGYPGNPIYEDAGFGPRANSTRLTHFLQNPNGRMSRGKVVLFGAATMKKRGILGKGDTSYDARYAFDRRLLTLAPPIFPSSTNIQVRTMSPSSPDNLPYRGTGGRVLPAGSDYVFMN